MAASRPALGLIASIAPPGSVVIERSAGASDHLKRPSSLPFRRREHLAGRAAAREALEMLLRTEAPAVGVGPLGEPLWPDGIVGSISHKRGYVVAIVSRANAIGAVGVDVEMNQALPATVLSAIASEAELAWLAANVSVQVPWPTVLFSAKESVYKAWFSRTRSALRFRDIAIRFTGACPRFEAAVAGHGHSARFLGTFVVAADLVGTVAVVAQ